jgi:hypothetical protein
MKPTSFEISQRQTEICKTNSSLVLLENVHAELRVSSLTPAVVVLTMRHCQLLTQTITSSLEGYLMPLSVRFRHVYAAEN